MSEPKHTPGPWTWRGTGDDKRDHARLILRRLDKPEERFIEHVRLGGGDGSQRVLAADTVTIEDARLIAAAPDLLAALRAFCRALQPRCTASERVAHREARAAIAKAEGTS